MEALWELTARDYAEQQAAYENSENQSTEYGQYAQKVKSGLSSVLNGFLNSEPLFVRQPSVERAGAAEPRPRGALQELSGNACSESGAAHSGSSAVKSKAQARGEQAYARWKERQAKQRQAKQGQGAQHVVVPISPHLEATAAGAGDTVSMAPAPVSVSRLHRSASAAAAQASSTQHEARERQHHEGWSYNLKLPLLPVTLRLGVSVDADGDEDDVEQALRRQVDGGCVPPPARELREVAVMHGGAGAAIDLRRAVSESAAHWQQAPLAAAMSPPAAAALPPRCTSLPAGTGAAPAVAAPLASSPVAAVSPLSEGAHMYDCNPLFDEAAGEAADAAPAEPGLAAPPTEQADARPQPPAQQAEAQPQLAAPATDADAAPEPAPEAVPEAAPDATADAAPSAAGPTQQEREAFAAKHGHAPHSWRLDERSMRWLPVINAPASAGDEAVMDDNTARPAEPPAPAPVAPPAAALSAEVLAERDALRAQLEQLRAQMAALQQQVGGQPPAAPASAGAEQPPAECGAMVTPSKPPSPAADAAAGNGDGAACDAAAGAGDGAAAAAAAAADALPAPSPAMSDLSGGCAYSAACSPAPLALAHAHGPEGARPAKRLSFFDNNLFAEAGANPLFCGADMQCGEAGGAGGGCGPEDCHDGGAPLATTPKALLADQWPTVATAAPSPAAAAQAAAGAACHGGGADDEALDEDWGFRASSAV